MAMAAQDEFVSAEVIVGFLSPVQQQILGGTIVVLAGGNECTFNDLEAGQEYRFRNLVAAQATYPKVPVGALPKHRSD